ncbi:MAG: hypothetical protein GY827_12690 [Cytophagales bacterium]|nr:hypothetical protein [Cytophagales bacterium]
MSEEQLTEEQQQEVVKQIYQEAAELKQQGKTDDEIVATLKEKGLDAEMAASVVQNLNAMIEERKAANNPYVEDDDDGDSAWGWLIWIGILVVVNLLSYIFDWPFWIY